ncbi:MAG: Gfo/Idh/MocA family protein [Planctomycetota bacterium]|jgi:predicted dehydrogenase
MKKNMKMTQRREFLKSGIAAGAGLLILPGGSLMGAGAPSNKMNVALIGVGGRGGAHQRALADKNVGGSCNVVALCDVDRRHLATTAKKYPKAKLYEDWRKCLDQKDLDAVICCTTDHTHSFIANWSLNRDLHIFCEKPLANTVEEARVVRATYMKKKHKLATQIGTQRHAKPNFERIRELVIDGAIGELTDCYAWGNRQIRRDGYLPDAGDPPEHLNYDLWLGPSPYHPYNPGYIGGCLKWNMYWDFGSGQIGDMGSHTIDLVWNVIDAELPATAKGEGEKYNPDVTPVELHTSFDFPANKWRGPITVHWYQGGMMPRSPKGYVDLKRIGHGAMFRGTRGYIICDYDSRIVLPFGDDADMAYYKVRDKKDMIPPLGHFLGEWINACKGDLKTHCDFKYAADAIETMLLGLVAYRVGKRIEYDGKTGRVTNSDKANELLGKEYRKGWTLNG